MEQNSRQDGHWWARRWRTWLRGLRLLEGERSTTGGRVKRLEVGAGRISATVQDRNGGACTVEITLGPWQDEQWQRAIDALGSQALFGAQLLAGKLPPELDQALSAAHVPLLPERSDEVTHRCSCDPARAQPCEHVSAVYGMLGEMIADDPWLLFRLRGRDQQQVLRALREQRTRGGEGATEAALPARNRAGAGETGFYRPGAGSSDDIAPLEAQVDQFWGSAKLQEEFHPQLVAPPVELALLRRLGLPPFADGAQETYERLAGVYRRITHEAITLAYATDFETQSAEQSDA